MFNDRKIFVFIYTMSVNIAQIGSQAVTKNSGNLADGCQRICIATNDVNISAINTNIDDIKADIATINTKIDQIYTILNAVYDTNSSSLKVSTI